MIQQAYMDIMALAHPYGYVVITFALFGLLVLLLTAANIVARIRLNRFIKENAGTDEGDSN